MGIEIFNPSRERAFLQGAAGITFDDAMDIQEWIKDRALTGGANGMLRNAVLCLLVGYNSDGDRLLRKVKEWYNLAIETNEKKRHYIKHGTDALRFSDLSLCNWLIENTNDSANLSNAVEQNELYYPPGGEADKIGLSLSLPTYLDAGCYDLVVERFESHPKLKMPTTLGKITQPGQMSYLLASHQINPSYSDDEVEKALQSFFRRFVHKELSEGGYLDVARWMKIAFWNTALPKPTSTEALLRSYNFMPFNPPARQ